MLKLSVELSVKQREIENEQKPATLMAINLVIGDDTGYTHRNNDGSWSNCDGSTPCTRSVGL